MRKEEGRRKGEGKGKMEERVRNGRREKEGEARGKREERREIGSEREENRKGGKAKGKNEGIRNGEGGEGGCWLGRKSS